MNFPARLKSRSGGKDDFVTFTVVSKYQRPTEDGSVEEASQYHHVAGFGREVVGFAEKHLDTGSPVHLKGRIRYSKYNDAAGNEQTGCDIQIAGSSAFLRSPEPDAQHLNRVRLVGNLGADPVIAKGLDGKPIARFSLATTERWNDKRTNEFRHDTQWHNIVAFDLCLPDMPPSTSRKAAS